MGYRQQVDVDRIVAAFNRCFYSHNTRLQGGAVEPYYVPADGRHGAARVCFRADYLRSALHEVAHWCIAGCHRRRLADYGYWYSPDNRSLSEQAAFFAVEAKPQALEKTFCEALGVPFAASIDNLNLTLPQQSLEDFQSRLEATYWAYRRHGLPERARRFTHLLQRLRRED